MIGSLNTPASNALRTVHDFQSLLTSPLSQAVLPGPPPAPGPGKTSHDRTIGEAIRIPSPSCPIKNETQINLAMWMSTGNEEAKNPNIVRELLTSGFAMHPDSKRSSAASSRSASLGGVTRLLTIIEADLSSGNSSSPESTEFRCTNTCAFKSNLANLPPSTSEISYSNRSQFSGNNRTTTPSHIRPVRPARCFAEALEHQKSSNVVTPRS
mmetsp:Transcript_40291/g.96607  ORF Transcript_40291/g.96607 Transcript_40291/m.96607 type:complete len:211 (+) Transcript_40291:2529-3161(+)